MTRVRALWVGRSAFWRVVAGLALLTICAACSGDNSEPAQAAADGGMGPSAVGKVQEDLSTVSVTAGGDELRSGWYPDQPNLSPSTIGGPTFGRLFTRAINGQVYAQPLVAANTLLVVTESNNVYGLDPETGAIRWSRNFGTPFSASSIPCADLQPTIGTTGTPVIDRVSNVAYMFSKSVSGSTVSYSAHALDVVTGNERPGFPIPIAGVAQNEPAQTFNARTQFQRAGLLLLDGVVYAAFGGHCDVTPWTGWVVGVSTTTAQITTMWVSQAGPNRTDGAGIWQSGDGLVSDGTGQILFATGNGGSPVGPISGHTPPMTLGESVVRLGVQPNGSLRATDFFAPYDAVSLDTWDADLSSGGPVGLPQPYFGTAQYPHLLVTVGKQGFVYLLDRDNLGGIKNGPSGGDAVLGRFGSIGGVWSKFAVWPGDGGYLYVPSASGGDTAGGSSGLLRVLKYGLDGTGKPTLALVGSSSGAFGFGSSAPVVTSDGTASGTALVWIIWMGDGLGSGAQLRAYDAVPVNGAPVLRFSAAIGTATKFTPPGIANGRVYVGTRDGNVIAFGAPTAPSLTATPVDFGNVTIGTTAHATLTITAGAAVTVTGVSSSVADFALGQTVPALPAMLQAGQTLQVPITFAPSSTAVIAGTVVVTTGNGSSVFAVSGKGQSVNAEITASPPLLSMGGAPLGGHLTGTVTFSNPGGAPLTISSVLSPLAPFGVQGAPPPGTVLAPAQSVTVTVTFDPTQLGNYSDAVGLNTTAGIASVPLSAMCTPPGHLTISTLAVPFGLVGVGQTKTAQFTLTNDGGSSVTITKSKPPILGPFSATTTLSEGTTIVAGASLTETVAFTPTAFGSTTDAWVINGGDSSGEQRVVFTGSGANDLTPIATPIALVTNPIGSGNHSLAVIKDGVFPAVGSADPTQQYDTYTGATRTEDWIGYQFASPQVFSQLVFQEGTQFSDGGWFTTLKVQVRQGGTWVDVPDAVVGPAYAGANGASFETFTFNFSDVVGDAIRVDGKPGGSATFISVAEFRVFSGGSTAPNAAPVANAGVSQSVLPGTTVTLDGSASMDPNGDPITYAWTQTAGPAVTLSSATTQKPTFVAPAVTQSTDLVFSLVVADGMLSSTPATIRITVAATASDLVDVTSTGTAIAFITAPTGGGSKSLGVISDGVFPAAGSTNSAQQYDTYTGATRTQDWVGYQFSAPRDFGKLVFQEGMQFGDGGWFTSLKVQVRQNGVWSDVPNATVTPAYPGGNGVTYETFTFTFPTVSGDGIRIFGAPGGAAKFISVGELRAWASSSGGSNAPPTAVAGPAQSVTAGTVVTLDGSGSSDPNGDPITYAWSRAGAGPPVTLSSATAQKPTFTAPAVTTSTQLTFNLVVSDGSLSSQQSSVTITVTPGNGAPVANAGPAQTVPSNGTVTLNGSGSSDPNGDPITYAWSQTAGPTVTLTGAATAQPTFTAPSVTVTTPLTFRLVVSDGSLSSAASTVTITVTAPNLAPVANAGPAQTVSSGAVVTLNGAASSDPNGDPITYAWSRVGAGPPVTLSSTTAQSPTFTAPTVTTSTQLTFSLVVRDAALSSTPSTVTVTINPATGLTDITSSGTAVALITAPTGGGNKSLSVIKDGVFPAKNSTNSAQQYDTYNGATRTEEWVGYTFTSAKSFGQLVFQEGRQFTDGGWFTSLKVQVRQGGTWVDVPGASVSPAYPGANGVTYETFTFTFPPIVGDGIRIDGKPGGASTFISVGELRAYGGSATGAPTASAGANQTVASGATVALDGSASSDPDGDPITYAWTQTGGPPVALSSTSAVSPTFTAPAASVVTNLTFNLVVSDLTASSAPATVTISVSPPQGTDITSSGTPIALVTVPTGGGNKSLSVIADNVFPALGSTDSTQQYDTYNANTRTEEWIGYSFASTKVFGKVVFQEGRQFADGGWFTTLKVQVRQNGTWTDVPNATISPAYAGANGVTFETFTFTFPAISGDAIRIDGAPGGAATFISVGELRTFTAPQ